MTVLMIYMFYKTFSILSVFSYYVSSGATLMDENTASTTYNVLMFISPVIVIILSLILLGVMALKKKPSSLYLINIVTYIYVITMFAVSKSTISTLEVTLLDIRTIKLVRDLSTLKSLVRAVGFDIRQFDFGKDLAELDISDKDSEEFELEVSFDTNKTKRRFNAFKRHFKYVYAENKFLINTVVMIVIILIGSLTFYGVKKAGIINNMNSTFRAGNFSFNVLNAYSTREDYKGNTLSGLNDKKSLGVIQTSIKSNARTSQSYDVGDILLEVNDHKFSAIDTYRDGIFDLGELYNGDTLTGKEQIYRTLVYELPTSFLDNDMTLKFVDSISVQSVSLLTTYSNVKINIKDLDSNDKTIDNIYDTDTTLTDSALYDTTLNIKSMEINRRYKIDYNYCVTSTECINSYEYIYAEANSNIDKYLLKIVGNVNYSDRITTLSNLYNLINNFGVLQYTINNQTKTVTTSLTKVDPTYNKSDTTLYIAVPKEVENASNVNLIFKIRNMEYKYIIK